MAHWKIRREETVLRTPWFGVALAGVELPDGRCLDHYVLRLPLVVLTAMLDDRDRVLLVWRYRFIPGTWGWELPSGLAGHGEDGPAAAAREALKETGWEPDRPRPLIRLEPCAGLADSVHQIYWAPRAERRGDPGFETERLEWIPLADTPAMIASGHIRAASTAAAALLLHHHPGYRRS